MRLLVFAIALGCTPYLWLYALSPLWCWENLLGPVRWFKTDALPGKSENAIDALLTAARAHGPQNPYARLYLGLYRATQKRKAEALLELTPVADLGREEMGIAFDLMLVRCIDGCEEPPVSREEMTGKTVTATDALRLLALPLFRRELDQASKLVGKAAEVPKSFELQRQASIFQFLRGEVRSAGEHLEKAWLLHPATMAPPSYGIGFVPFRFLLEERESKLQGRFSPWMGRATTWHRELQEASAETLYNLAVFHRNQRAFKRSLYLAQLLSTEYPRELAAMDAGKLLDRYLYPCNYADEVEHFAARYKVDPFLVYALIREESHYEAGSVSPAGALGLMQLMPQTGRWIAGRLKIAGFYDRQLLDPIRNIELGNWYLNHLASQLPADARTVDWVLAAYNGGPANAQLWIVNWKQRGGSPVEHITFAETRDYVTKVKKSWENYRRIWHLPGPVRLRG